MSLLRGRKFSFFDGGEISRLLALSFQSLLPRQLLSQDSTTDVSDSMAGDTPVSYELKSTVEESADAIVTTTISSSTAEGEVPQQQVITESSGGEELGMITFNPGEEVSASVNVTGDDVTMELRREEE